MLWVRLLAGWLWLRLLVGRLWLIRWWLLVGGLRHLLGLEVDDVPCSDFGKPLTLPLSPVNVKRGCNILPDLQGEPVYGVSEELDGYFPGVLPARFKDEHL